MNGNIYNLNTVDIKDGIYCIITMATCIAFRSASLYTATVWIPRRLAERMTLQAISPRLAINIFDRGVTTGATFVEVGDDTLPAETWIGRAQQLEKLKYIYVNTHIYYAIQYFLFILSGEIPCEISTNTCFDAVQTHCTTHKSNTVFCSNKNSSNVRIWDINSRKTAWRICTFFTIRICRRRNRHWHLAEPANGRTANLVGTGEELERMLSIEGFYSEKSSYASWIVILSMRSYHDVTFPTAHKVHESNDKLSKNKGNKLKGRNTSSVWVHLNQL